VTTVEHAFRERTPQHFLRVYPILIPMQRVFIIHGAYSTVTDNWYTWLATELTDLGCRVIVPQFPTPKDQSLANWLAILKRYEPDLENAIVVGHSLGVPFLLSVIEKSNVKINAAYFVAGFADLLNIPKFDLINSTFIDKPFRWEKIKQNCRKIVVIHSDNDPYIPLPKAVDYAKNLGVNVSLVKSAGHFNAKNGFTSFPFLLQKIRGDLQ
jgi:predicted alpha/beta hydrolase family esterase